MRVVESEAKSILVASKLPDADYVINPYTGCAFGCSYCYATFMGRYVGETAEEWGQYVYVKTNAVILAREEIPKLQRTHGSATLLLSSVTDPYQGVESKYRLTRGVLGALVDASWAGRVSILTKSPLVTRDIDLFRSLTRAEVGLTVTSTDDRVSKWLEVRAPKASARIAALAELRDAGVPVYAFVGPLLPHFRQSRSELDELFEAISSAGVREVYVEHMNLKPYIRERLEPRLAGEPQSIRDSFAVARQREMHHEVDELVNQLLSKHNLHLRLGEVLDHQSGVAAAAVHRAPAGLRSDSVAEPQTPRPN
ncbi:MAG: radical SAM protein [Brooklawnia sp.]|nr:radical SAM protein [Brooklawnia sp.]